MGRSWRVAAAAAVLAVGSTRAHAQQMVAPELASGPTFAASTVGVQPASLDATEAVTTTANAAKLKKGVPLMIVGGAALITGLIIGGDVGTVIAVGGGLLGLYGLYVFLKTDEAKGDVVGMGVGMRVPISTPALTASSGN
jgi:hypothetical protein